MQLGFTRVMPFVSLSFAAAILFVACSTTTATPSMGAVADADASPEMPACSADAGTCTQSATCCTIEGERIDLEGRCSVRGGSTILNCEPNRCPIPTDVVGCYQRTTATGVVETYLTTDQVYLPRLGPGFRECSDSVSQTVNSIDAVCP